jgi:hypothetical protein
MVGMSAVSSGSVMTVAEFERLREADDGLARSYLLWDR